MKKLKLLSLCPQESKDYENEADLLIDKMATDSEIKNIGVVAQYGAGKSSFIKTLKGKCEKESKSNFKFLDISLATFNVPEKDGDDEEDEIDLNNVEKSILQQIIFKKEKKDTPSSQIKRINNFTWKKFWIWLFLILSCVLSIALFSILIVNFNGKEIYRFSGWKIAYPILGSVLFLVFAFLVAYNINLSKIAIKGVEIEINEGKESLLNKHIDEIIYYFQKTNYNVVVFEDLDRFNSLEIFVKLRELNFLLNNNDKIRKNKDRLIFIYAIRNDIFKKATERVKFFDLIISLNPVLSQLNVNDYLVSYLNESGLGENWLSKSFIHDISFYIKDMRILKSIINDCVIYYKQNFKVAGEIGEADKKGTQLDDAENIKAHEQLFALMTYKNVYPDQFEKMEKGEGELYDLIDEAKKSNIIYNNNITYIRKNFDSVTKGKEITELLKAIIKAGFIDDNYKRYIFKRGGAFLSDNDELFSRMLITKEPPIFELNLYDIGIILRDVSEDKLNCESALNFDLVNYLFDFDSLDVQEEQLNAIEKLLISKKAIVGEFLKEYLLIKHNYNPELIKSIMNNRKDVFDLVETAGLNREKIKYFLALVFKECSSTAIEGQANKVFIKNHIKEDDQLITELEQYKDKVSILKNSGIIIKQLRKYDYSQSLLKIIADNNFWILNLDNLCYLLSKLYGISEEDVAIQGISFINKINDRNLLSYILSDKRYYVESVMLKAKELNLSVNDFRTLIYDESFDIEKRKEIIHKQKTSLVYATALQVNTIFECLLTENKITITPNNLYNLIYNYPIISNSLAQFISLNIDEYTPNKLPLNAQVILCLANSTATVNGKPVIYSFINEISQNPNLINITSIENEKSLCILIENSGKSLNKEDIAYICRDDFEEAPLVLLRHYNMEDIFTKDLGNNRLAHLCIRHSVSVEVRELIYKGTILDIDNDDFAFAKLMADDIVLNKFELADNLYERLIRFNIDKESLYLSQMDYMPANVVLKRLKEIGPLYNKLAEETKLSSEEMDFGNDICQALISKDYASIRRGRGRNRGKDNLILKITA